jgi:hypothetical protein
VRGVTCRPHTAAPTAGNTTATQPVHPSPFTTYSNAVVARSQPQTIFCVLCWTTKFLTIPRPWTTMGSVVAGRGAKNPIFWDSMAEC